MKAARRRLGAMEFDALMPLLKISDDRRAAARAALVDGKSFASIARIYGWTPQAVNGAVTAVWRTNERFKASQHSMSGSEVILPPGWERVTLIAPTYIVVRLREEIAKVALEQLLLVGSD